VTPADLSQRLNGLIATWENEVVEFKQAGNDIGRLAVDIQYQGKGCGDVFMADALERIVSAAMAASVILVDTKGIELRRSTRASALRP
jgi:predicted N-acetyltransferase YhbS